MRARRACTPAIGEPILNFKGTFPQFEFALDFAYQLNVQ
jgi:hypothetical protein